MSAGYLQTMGIRLLQGRWLSEEDMNDSSDAAIVSDLLQNVSGRVRVRSANPSASSAPPNIRIIGNGSSVSYPAVGMRRWMGRSNKQPSILPPGLCKSRISGGQKLPA